MKTPILPKQVHIRWKYTVEGCQYLIPPSLSTGINRKADSVTHQMWPHCPQNGRDTRFHEISFINAEGAEVLPIKEQSLEEKSQEETVAHILKITNYGLSWQRWSGLISCL